MTDVECFWLEPIDQVRVSLRRYGRNSRCAAGKSYCNAEAPLTTVSAEDANPTGDLWPHEDPRWPTRCASCGHPFKDHDHWQLRHARLYGSEGYTMTLHEAPPGAMWSADWYEGGRTPGPDGRWLVVRLPSGQDWFIDGNASGHPEHVASWTRTGEVPYVTVTPSVKTGEWHGWLVNGVFKKSG